jgi:putative hydrolase of the HAD superfamily
VRSGNLSSPYGGVAQLAEHYVRNVGVAGSNPVTSTKGITALPLVGDAHTSATRCAGPMTAGPKPSAVDRGSDRNTRSEAMHLHPTVAQLELKRCSRQGVQGVGMQRRRMNQSMAGEPIEAVVFDFGGVFTSSPSVAVRAAATEAGIDPEAFLEMMLGSYGEESDHPWQRVERGEIALAEARSWARAESKLRFGVEMDPMKVMAPLMSEPPRPAMLSLASDLRDAGISTALLTNNAKELGEHWRSLADWDGLLDVVVDSSAIGVRKPSKEAFEYALDALGVRSPSAALMVDDFAVNVDGARQAGMQAVQVGDDPTLAIREVRGRALGHQSRSVGVMAHLALPALPR